MKYPSNFLTPKEIGGVGILHRRTPKNYALEKRRGLPAKFRLATVPRNVRLRRSKPAPPPASSEKPYLVTIHAPGEQHHTFAMGPGDAIGVGAIRIDIAPDGGIHASPNAPDTAAD